MEQQQPRAITCSQQGYDQGQNDQGNLEDNFTGDDHLYGRGKVYDDVNPLVESKDGINNGQMAFKSCSKIQTNSDETVGFHLAGDSKRQIIKVKRSNYDRIAKIFDDQSDQEENDGENEGDTLNQNKRESSKTEELMSKLDSFDKQ